MNEIKFTNDEERQQYEAWRAKHADQEKAAYFAWLAAQYGWETEQRLQNELAELKEQMAAIGAGGVEPLRKRADAAQQAAQAAVPEEIEQMAADRYKVVPSHESMLHRWAVVADNGAQQLYIGREGECQNMARKFMGAFLDGAFVAIQNAAPAHPAEGVPAQAVALLATGGQAQAVKLLAADHSGMKVDYRGLFSQVQRALKRTDPGYAEMLRQLEGHLQELGQRWYAGDTDVVDEMLQLYCIECNARKTFGTSATAAAQAKQGEQANG